MGSARNQRQKKKVKYIQLILFHPEGQIEKNASRRHLFVTIVVVVVVLLMSRVLPLEMYHWNVLPSTLL